MTHRDLELLVLDLSVYQMLVDLLLMAIYVLVILD